MLLAERVDVNLLDYKGATPLHRVKDAATMQVYWAFCYDALGKIQCFEAVLNNPD